MGSEPFILIAEFQARLPAPLIVRLPEGAAEPEVSAETDKLNVSVRLKVDEFSGYMTLTDRICTSACEVALVTVAGEEAELPPAPADVVARASYFRERLARYAPAGMETLRRFVRFFRTRLKQGTPATVKESDFYNAVWRNDRGDILGGGALVFSTPNIPGLCPPLFGLCAFEGKHQGDIENALNLPIEPSLVDELLSDARIAALSGDLRRAALDLAIACEVAVKNTLFSSSVAGSQVSKLAARGKLQFSVPDLTDWFSQDTAGSRFRDQHPDDYVHIQRLFRCRNTIAHRGVAEYSDGNTVQSLTPMTLDTWWAAAETLLTWLRRL